MNYKAIAIGGTALGLAVGSVAGYFVANKRLKTKYENLAQTEIDSAKEYMKVLHKREEYSTPASAVQRRIPGATLTEEDKKGDPYPEPPLEVVERVLDGLRYRTPASKLVQKPRPVTTLNVFEGRHGPASDELAAEINARDSRARATSLLLRR